MQERKSAILTEDGLELACVVTIPQQPRATALLLHGFTSGKNNKTNKALIPHLNGANIATVRFDFRGHYDSQGDIADTTISLGVSDATRILESDVLADCRLPELPLLLFGSSYGGSVLLDLAPRVAPLAIALRSPVSDYVEMRTLQLGDQGMRHWRSKGVIDVGRNGAQVLLKYSFIEDARKLDLYANAHGLAMPALVVHGTSDEEVPITQSERLVREMGTQARLLPIAGANHGYSNPAHFEQLVAAVTGHFISCVQQ